MPQVSSQILGKNLFLRGLTGKFFWIEAQLFHSVIPKWIRNPGFTPHETIQSRTFEFLKAWDDLDRARPAANNSNSFVPEIISSSFRSAARLKTIMLVQPTSRSTRPNA